MLIVCASGIGDVYELEGGDSITTTNEGRAGTVNAKVFSMAGVLSPMRCNRKVAWPVVGVAVLL